MKLAILKSTGEVVDDRQSGDPPDYVIKENIAKQLKINQEVIEVIKVPENQVIDCLIAKKIFYKDGKLSFEHYPDYEQRVFNHNRMQEQFDKLIPSYVEAFQILQPLFPRKCPRIEKLLDKLNEIFSEKVESENLRKIGFKIEYRNSIDGVIHKMSAMWYHYSNIVALEEEYENKIKEYHEKVPLAGWEAVGVEKIEFEFEAFLMQAKACLDIFSRTFKFYFRNIDARDTKDLREKLEKCLREPEIPQIIGKKEMCEKILAELKSAEWLKDFESRENETTYKSRRDRVAHRGKIPITPINLYIQKQSHESEVKIAGVISPPTIDKVPLKSYTEKLMDNIFGLVERCYLILLQ